MQAERMHESRDLRARVIKLNGIRWDLRDTGDHGDFAS